MCNFAERKKRISEKGDDDARSRPLLRNVNNSIFLL